MPYYYDFFHQNVFPDVPVWLLMTGFFFAELLIMIHIWMIALFNMFFCMQNLFSVHYWLLKMQ